MTIEHGTSTETYQIADLVFNVGQRRLSRNGKEILLSKLTFGLLLTLVRSAPNLVTHAMLVDTVWGPKRIVTPETLTKRMMALRRALGDSAAEPRYIEGIRGQGYRLIPAVERIESLSGNETHAREGVLFGRLGSRIGRWLTYPWILVATLLVGLILASGWLLIVNREGGESHDDQARARVYFRQAREFEWPTENHEEHLQATVRLLQRAVEEDPDFVEAWARLSNAHVLLYWFRFDTSSSRAESALTAAHTALRLDPVSPEAHWAIGSYHYRVNEDLSAALNEMETAESLGGDITEVQLLKGFVLRRMGDLEGAIAAFERALKHEPDNLVLIVTLAESYTSSRRYADADRLLERGALLAADPRTFRIRQAFLSMYESGDSRPANRIFESEGEPHQWNEELWLSWLVAIYERDYARAIAMLDGPDAGAIVPFPSYIFPKWSQLAVSHLLAGKAERALHYYELSRTQVELALTDNPADPDLLLALAETLVGIGESSEGIATARNVLHSAPAANRLRSVALRVFIPAGAHEEAIEELDAYLSEPGDWAIEGLLPDPRLDPIRHHSRFLALVEKHQRASN